MADSRPNKAALRLVWAFEKAGFRNVTITRSESSSCTVEVPTRIHTMCFTVPDLIDGHDLPPEASRK